MFFIPSASSEMPARMPEKVMTLVKPASAVASIDLVTLSRQNSWFSTWFHPFTNPWLPVMAQARPYFLRIGQCLGSISSTLLRPMAAAPRQRVSTSIELKHQWMTDWLTRPLTIFQLVSSAAFIIEGAASPAAATPTAPARRLRRVGWLCDGMGPPVSRGRRNCTAPHPDRAWLEPEFELTHHPCCHRSNRNNPASSFFLPMNKSRMIRAAMRLKVMPLPP